MRRSNEMVPVSPGVVMHPRTPWEMAARKALDQWSGSAELNIATALELSYRDAIAFAEKFQLRLPLRLEEEATGGER